MKKRKTMRRILSLVLCVSLLLSLIPVSVFSTSAIKVVGAVADPGTADGWEKMMGTDKDGNRYAGRVWADKSVYTDGQTVVLNNKQQSDSTFSVNLEDNEAFQIIFSALGSSMSTKTTSSSSGPKDVVLVLDTSTSMDDYTSGNKTRLQAVIEAANKLLSDLSTINGVRLSIVTYNADSETVLPLNAYTNGVQLKVNNYLNNNRPDAGVVYALDNDGRQLGKDSGYTMGTNLQAGIDRGFNILANADNVEGRLPVAIVLTDGQANRAVRTNWYNLSAGTVASATDANLALSTMLNAAYNKAKIDANYGTEAKVYSVSVDLDADDEGHALMNPADPTHGFNSNNNHKDIRDAYSNFLKWSNGQTVTSGNYYNSWVFDHNYPTTGGITRQNIIDNINYVDPDAYYDVSSAELEKTFAQIYEELTSSAFNPISTTEMVDGATGVKNTPLIYVDKIGRYMEIKEIQAITLFGKSYSVISDGNGGYTVAAGSGTNPTTGEQWNTQDDIIFSVTETDGLQRLEVKINQEILPIILEQVESTTVANVTNATINELSYSPLRVFYTVGVREDILLPSGDIDATKIDANYAHINGNQITLYSNDFGSTNTADSATDNDSYVDFGDAHIGFRPSPQNRYYYHQVNEKIFTAVSRKDGYNIQWEPDEYGARYKESEFNATQMEYVSFAEYNLIPNDKEVYTLVKYFHPTASTSDAANAAEEVTYLINTTWGYLKESAAFYDATAKVYVNYNSSTNTFSTDKVGYAIPLDKVEATMAAYLQANPGADIKVYLGVNSLRTSRLHNMEIVKSNNYTQTATMAYAPVYTHEQAKDHSDNDVVIWLGNNGRLTVEANTGIALTKEVTEPIGTANDLYALTVTVPSTVSANPVVRNGNGEDITLARSTWANHILTVLVKAGETVYVSGIPSGTVCTIGENIPASATYYISDQTQTVTIPSFSDAVSGTADQYVKATVTNSPRHYGNLYIIKEIESSHTIPAPIYDMDFTVEVDVGAALAGKTFDVLKTDLNSTSAAVTVQKTVDTNGKIILNVKARQTFEILNLPENTNVTVKEVLSSAQADIFTASYRTRNHSGETADNDQQVVIPSSGSATAVITNTYLPKFTTVDLDVVGTKELDAEGDTSMLLGGTFTFKVQQWDKAAAKWNDVIGKSTGVSYAAAEEGTKNFLIEDVLNGIEYKEVGTWTYQVVEVKGNINNLTYDRTLYTFTVSVTDDNGQLKATVTDLANNVIQNTTGDAALDYAVSFKNTYHTAPVSIDITKNVTNLSGDSDVSKAGFVFKAVRTDAQWNTLTGATASSLVVYSDGAGKARVTATYTDAGTYYYLLSEENTSKNGWDYSDAKYRVTVSVAENNGNLTSTMTIVAVDGTTANGESASVSGNNGTVSFVNTYDPDNATVNLNTAVLKKLDGKTLSDNAFTFKVYKNGTKEEVLSGTNAADGKVTFNKALTFEAAGKYEYDVVEINDHKPGYTYDETIYDLVVEVVNNSESGKLEATYYFEDSTTKTVTFQNKYDVKATTYAIGGRKILKGRAAAAGEFTFGLYEGNVLLEKVSNKADSTFTFAPISYTKAGVYTYTVKEIAPADQDKVPGVTYTGAEAANDITVVVRVEDQNSVLVASANIQNANIVFENSYKAASASVEFSGKKTLQGGNLKDGDFTFKLYQTDHTFDLSTATCVDVKTNVGNAFAFGARSFDTADTYFFTVVEDASNPVDGIIYDAAQHNYRVQVRDHGTGQLKLTVLDLTTGITTHEAENARVEASFVNATEDSVTKKEVYHKANTTTQIDGKKVSAGDILTYFITYTNYHGKNVAVDIVDTIPAHTSYVDGTASHNGSFVGSHLNWVLNVAAGESVTVSFDVKVEETNAIVANTAVVRDGTNTYATNEVVNHTVDDVTKKEVFLSSDPTVSVDGKKVYAGDELLYVVSYTNASSDEVDITITDKIPENTTYVDASADNGGVYSAGTITWNLSDVKPWSTVKVGFSVTVNKVAAVNITNKANVDDGKNQYTTNVVTNYTVEDKVEKKVFFADKTTVNIDGQKVYAGDVLLYTISYTNSADEKATVTITDTIPNHTVYVDGSADHSGVHNNGEITWTLEVDKKATKTVSFKVTVKDDGAEQIVNTAKVQEGKNSYTTNGVTNYTTEDEVQKNVFLAGVPTISIDGQKIHNGDILVYSISYTNKSIDEATITITDTLSEHVKYVDGSADQGGVYADGTVTWTLNVKANETVTVAFKAKADAAVGTAITNKATVVEGRNSYTTNEVKTEITTPTDVTPPETPVLPPEQPPVQSPVQPTTPTIPDTGDTMNLWMWIALMVVSGGCLFGTLRVLKQKED